MNPLRIAFPYYRTRKDLLGMMHTQEQYLAHLDRDLTAKDSAIAVKDEEARQWRAAYEEVTSSPEIKADTEAAFKRGEEHARKKIGPYLLDVADEISASLHTAVNNIQNPYRLPVQAWPQD